tara:strand:- start:273 stop:452 length:180 start_codon:yes stop_codon:yes gene_type:complete
MSKIFGTEKQQQEEFNLKQKHHKLIYPDGLRGTKCPYRLQVLRVIDNLVTELEEIKKGR